jgi:DNA-3-methyladenine glycosylase II
MGGVLPETEVPASLTDETFAHGLYVLCDRDPDLAQIRMNILEQQVSLASARAAFDRLLAAASPLTPARFLELDDAELKTIGFSRQKTAYGRELAGAILGGRLNLAELETLDDADVRSELMDIKGIGPWTADIYLLMALRRPDVWPSGDLALASAAQRVKRLAARPTPDELDTLGADWTPWRAVAARLLWHYYLSDPV